MSFVITDELSVMVTKITSRIGVYTLFTQSLLRVEIMAGQWT